MRHTRFVFVCSVLLFAACHTAPEPPVSAAVAAPQPATAPTPGSAAAQSPENRAINERFVQRFMQSIAGTENEPAEKVFENIQTLKGVPARQLVSIMIGGYAAALGVTCTHCHVESDFASDDKRPKRAAREMAVMHRSVNTQLRQMKELASQPAANRAINCTTCHRGRIDPTKG